MTDNLYLFATSLFILFFLLHSKLIHISLLVNFVSSPLVLASQRVTTLYSLVQGATSDLNSTVTVYKGLWRDHGQSFRHILSVYPATDYATAENQSFVFWNDLNRASLWNYAQA